MDRTIRAIISKKLLKDTLENIKPALKYQFGAVKHLLTKEDWEEINCYAQFLTISIYIETARVIGMAESDIESAIIEFMESEQDHIDDMLLFKQRAVEYTPLFNLFSPSPLVSLTTCFLNHLSVDISGGMMPLMMWTNSLVNSTMPGIASSLSLKQSSTSYKKSGGGGCLTIIVVSCILLFVLFCLL